jgi:uncharacterized membrane protein YcaP (DUF421 family)
MLEHMFHLNSPVLEKILRPVIVYFAIILLLRVFGKRELAQLNPFDLVVLLSVSNTVQNAIIGDDNSVTGGLLGALSLFAINYAVVRFLFRHRRLDEVLAGSPTHLIVNGRVDRDALAKELLTEAELSSVVHRQGFDELDEVESCTLEPGGAFAIRGRKPGSDDLQHAEVIAKLAELQKGMELLRARMENSVN